MRRCGQIVNISSLAGKISLPLKAPYCAAKFALNGYMECLQLDVCADWRCLSVCLPACLPACLSVCLSVCLSACLSLLQNCNSKVILKKIARLSQGHSEMDKFRDRSVLFTIL